ncbi:dihydroneopterin aldolase [Microbaculum marinum]|uniref:7,8-dihydroneopterin aldolase n=1 Tax=Microbaculum marinum TaxID=1764581 RepID=A0AAW9RZK0_9HYPH
MSDRIFLRGIVLFGHHGVFEEEKRLGQRFELDLDCRLDLSRAGRTDSVRDTADYGAIYETVRTVVEDMRFKLIEALAEEIARRLLAGFEAIQGVRVEIRKPSAPIRGVFDTVGIEIDRDRSR